VNNASTLCLAMLAAYGSCSRVHTFIEVLAALGQ